LIAGVLSFAGESGSVSVSVGSAGAVESSTYVIGLEQGETFPAASVAVARYVTVALLLTETVRPGDAKLAALPWAATVDVQMELV
jgi:hypothetical protein